MNRGSRMNKGPLLWKLAKALEGLGLVVILVGVMWSINLGFQDRSLESMGYEFRGLGVGGALFALGWLIERKLGAR
jgi:hypothetical protein